MPSVPVPNDLSRVKKKGALNLTKRHLICFGCAAIIGVPTYLLTRGTLGTEGAVLLMMGLMLPFFFFAMYEKDGQPAEKIIRNWLRANIWPSTRPYKTENLYEYVEKEGKALGSKKQAAGRAGKAPAGRAKAGSQKQGRAKGHAAQ